MHKLSKSKIEQRRQSEKLLVATLRDKLDAHANAQLKEDHLTEKHDHKIINEYKHSQPKRTSKKSLSQIEAEINLLLKANELIEHHNKPDTLELKRDENWMIHLDWDGKFRRPDDTDYSEEYVRARQIIGETLNSETSTTIPSYNAKDYNLDLSPAWLEMQKYQSFASCGAKVRNQLAIMQIPPEIIPKMNFFDFSEILYYIQRDNKTPPFECSRSKNLKMFEACYGFEFKQVMHRLHYKPEYIKTVRQNMRKGICDPLLNFHHKNNIFRCKEMPDFHKANNFSNTMLTFVHPHHRLLHFRNGYDFKNDLAFFGGFDPIFQIKRDPEREREYLNNPNKFIKKHAEHSK